MILSKRIANLFNWFSKVKNNSFVKHGLPFIVFVVGGSFALKNFTTIRYELSQHKQQLGVTQELLEDMGFSRKTAEPVKSIEEVYSEMVKTTDINSWKNVRGPRPWETDNTEYMDVIAKRYEQTKNK